ncbi:MAG: DNA repair protein RecO [Prevotella sp.]|nr:DNA repair protein RecO [Prevotella sp.]
MILKSKAIVLRSLKFGESSLIVDMFTEAEGRVSFMTHIPKTSKGKIKKQYFQPLSLLELEFDFRQRVSLQRIREVRLLHPYASIPFDPVKSAILLFLSEFLYYVTRGEQQNPYLYNYVLTSMEWLDEAEREYANFHLVFMMRLSRFVGFYPNLEAYRPGAWFDLRNATFCGHAPLHPDYLLPAEASGISLLMRMDYENMHLFRLSRHDRNRIAETVLRYYRIHVPDMPELKSFQVMREVFG